MTTNITIPLATLEQLVGALNEVDQRVDLKRYDTAPNEVLFDVVMAALAAGRAALEGAERVGWQPTCKQDLQVLFPRHTPHRIDNWTIAPAFLTRVLHTIAPDTPYDFIPTMEQVEQVLLAIEVIPTAEYIAAPAPQAQPICKLFGTLPVYDSPAPQPAQVGINGLTEAETSASMSVLGLSKPAQGNAELIARSTKVAAELDDFNSSLDRKATKCIRELLTALQSAQPAVANIQTKIVKDISAHEGGKQQSSPLPTTELDALGCAYCNHHLFLGSKCKNCGKEAK